MRRRHRWPAWLSAAGLLFAAFGCSAEMTDLSERYVKLVLAVGVHDADYVDAFYGPPEWRAAAAEQRRGIDELDADAAALLKMLADDVPPPRADEIERLRHRYLTTQVESLRARLRMLRGERLTFDEESAALYDAVAPVHTEQEFQAVLRQLDERLPGGGSFVDRYQAFRNRFEIPKDRLSAVFAAAIDGCRARTLEHVALPPTESFTIEYVTNKSWSGYNWYQGDYRSLIQINTDLPIYIDRAIDLACHEGYPGHHVYNVLLEQHLTRERGWQEFSVYALFSPQSLIAEGTANYGIEVAFPDAERRRFERDVLFPAAGLDASRADEYYDVLELVEKLSYAGNEAARRYRDGQIDASAAARWLETYALYSPDRAAQRVRFIDQYGAYVINYNLGKDLVARYIERHAGVDPARRWSEFAKLLSSPRLPSGLED
ncbi:MAG TPA: hypothetical protein VLI71_04740 [Gammaproteobacteria bacterium]|nr:hypothetical protein [Gammaproteobacteria bacterium]